MGRGDMRWGAGEERSTATMRGIDNGKQIGCLDAEQECLKLARGRGARSAEIGQCAVSSVEVHVGWCSWWKVFLQMQWLFFWGGGLFNKCGFLHQR